MLHKLYKPFLVIHIKHIAIQIMREEILGKDVQWKPLQTTTSCLRKTQANTI